MDTQQPTKSIASIGAVAAELQLTTAKIAAAADELNIQPELRINQVPYFDSQDVERINEHIRAGQAQQQKQGQ